VRVDALPGDVGRRRYLRLELPHGGTVLGVAYPAEEADSRRRWVEARAALESRVRVPRLLADDAAGNQIIEDFGASDLAQRLTDDAEGRGERLSAAVAAASAIAATPDPRINPPFDAAFFRRELDLAREAVFERWLDLALEPVEREAHDAWAHALCREIAAYPRVLCHRDFHGNNLFLVEEEIAAIDFQDLREGPDAYDLASLLWERTTLGWMTEEIAERAVSQLARARGIAVADLSARFDRVLLQRAWKVCGTFARAVAAGRGDAYRRYLPGELALVGRLLGKSPADRGFRRVYERRLAPLC
jgi:aminoglycoside/choline kinase family phosphotransferase